jgi:sec-independent protein translocase protein TatA
VTLAIFQGIGPVELLIVLGLVLLILGPKRLPALGRQLGGGMKEFGNAIRGRDSSAEDAPAASAPLTHAESAGRTVDGEAVSERR